ncbi:porin family protein [Natroniella acetigena]|uniref:porin family protein n=1 Tax=Natroniella acetigena TaxID=52004 RepID=UPI00200AC6E5|nr:porin family protein [Natroniella acetigena]MCK8827007.1 porin family protein [Natroniella acetigena]
MKRLNLVLGMVVLLLLAQVGVAWGLPQAEIRQGRNSIGYSIQRLDGEIKSMIFEGDFGLTPTLGLDTRYFYFEDGDDLIDLNLKVKIIDDRDFNLTGLVGRQFNSNDDKTQVGMLLSQDQSQYITLNAGVNILLDSEDSLGYSVGFDYMLTRAWYLEAGFRGIAGKSDHGLTIGLRNYL